MSAPDLQRESTLAAVIVRGLHGAQSGLKRLQISERGPTARLLLRAKPDNASLLERIEAVIGLALPLAANTSTSNATCSILWLGPDEWLLCGELGATVVQQLRECCPALVDLSHGRSVVRVSGERARELIAKGCGLDLHPRVFGPGRCAQSALARCNVLIHQIDDKPSFDIYVMRSLGRSVWHFLTEAAQEFGYEVV